MNPERLTGIVLAASFVALILCGAGLLVIHMDEHSHVSGCPTTDTSCPLSTVDRLSTFAAVPGASSAKLISLVLSAALFVAAAMLIASILLSVRHRPRRFLADDAALWHPLQFAFARGILNPKPY